VLTPFVPHLLEHFDLLHMSKTMKTHRSVLMSAKSAVAPAAGTGTAADAGADGKAAADQQKAESKGSAGRAIKVRTAPRQIETHRHTCLIA